MRATFNSVLFQTFLVLEQKLNTEIGRHGTEKFIVCHVRRLIRSSCEAAGKVDLKRRCASSHSFLTRLRCSFYRSLLNSSHLYPFCKTLFVRRGPFCKTSFYLLFYVTFLFPQRVQLFRKLVAKDKEELGITRPSDDFLPHGTLITVQRSRLLEVKDVSLQLTCSRCDKSLLHVLGGVFLSQLYMNTTELHDSCSFACFM